MQKTFRYHGGSLENKYIHLPESIPAILREVLDSLAIEHRKDPWVIGEHVWEFANYKTAQKAKNVLKVQGWKHVQTHE